MLGWLLALAAGTLVVSACTPRDTYPTKPKLSFVIEDQELEAIFWEALQEWMDAGLVSATQVTVNVDPKGLHIEWSDPDKINANCDIPDVQLEPGRYVGGCTLHEYGHFRNPLWITKLPGDESRKRIKLNIMHEIIHIIVPTREHLPDEQPGIMNIRANSEVVTDADMLFLAERTRVA